MGSDRLDISKSAHRLLGYPMMRTRLPLCAAFLVVLVLPLSCQVQNGWSAQFVDSKSEPPTILADFGGPVLYDPQTKTAILSDGSSILDLGTVILLLPTPTGMTLITADA